MRAKEIKAATRALQLLERRDLLDHETFEAVAPRGRGEQLICGTDAEQIVQQAAVADIHLGRFDETFLQVGMKGLEPTHQKISDEQVEQILNGVIVVTERAGQGG